MKRFFILCLSFVLLLSCFTHFIPAVKATGVGEADGTLITKASFLNPHHFYDTLQQDKISIEERDALIVEKIREFVGAVALDFYAFDFENIIEQKAIDASFFSAYRGELVVKTPFKRSGYLNLIFLSNNESTNADLVRHEYGHTKQREWLGRVNYLAFIFLPSLLKLGEKDYYNKPWEVTADIFGGVDSRFRSSEDIEAGYQYFEIVGSDMPLLDKYYILSKYY